MTAPKIETHSETGCCNAAGASVYELANAASKEAKRINQIFFEAKKMPPKNVVITALKRVMKGQVGYSMRDGEPREQQDDPGDEGSVEEE